MTKLTNQVATKGTHPKALLLIQSFANYMHLSLCPYIDNEDAEDKRTQKLSRKQRFLPQLYELMLPLNNPFGHMIVHIQLLPLP